MNPNAKLWEQQLGQYLDKLSPSEDALDLVDHICSLSIKLLNEINSSCGTSHMQSPK
jgi:hypothetical protein